MPTRPTPVTRRLTAADIDQSVTLGVEAFGAMPPGTPLPSAADFPFPGRDSWGTFVGERLVARMIGREFHSWFHGTPVPTCGIAGVTVVAEHRGEGLLEPLFRAVLSGARARGEVISTLFPTAPGIYRRLGYELVGSYDAVEVPAGALAAVPAPERTTVRRAVAGDLDAVRRVYDAWAAAQNGPLTRRGPSFPAPDEEVLAEFTGITLAVDERGEVVGFASWQRGSGYDERATLEVSDLVALTADGHRALWRVLGSFGTVTGRVRLHTSDPDAARLVLPATDWRVVRTHPYMLRVDDVAGAFSALPLVGTADLSFAVAGDALGTMDGGYRLVVGDGAATCSRAEVAPDAPVFSPQGLALAYAGAQSCANIRMAGHLTGSTSADAALDALLGGRQVHIRDYF